MTLPSRDSPSIRAGSARVLHKPPGVTIPELEVEPPHEPPAKPLGFTIVELLVAMAISVVVIVLLTTVVGQCMLISRRTSAQLQALNAANAALDLIAADLGGVNATRQPYEYLQVLTDTNSSLTGAGVHPMRLMMLSTSAEDAAVAATSGSNQYPDSGLVHAVDYQILYQDPLAPAFTSGSAFGLYRAVVSSSNTFSNSTAPLLGGSNEYTFWNAVSLSSTATDPKLDFIAPNVVDLEIAIYVNLAPTSGTTATSGTSILYNPAVSGTSTFQQAQLTGTGTVVAIPPTPPALPTGYSAGIPAYAEVSVTVLEDRGATLWGKGTGTGSLSPASLKLQYGHTLSRRIPLPAPQ